MIISSYTFKAFNIFLLFVLNKLSNVRWLSEKTRTCPSWKLKTYLGRFVEIPDFFKKWQEMRSALEKKSGLVA